LPVEQAPEPEVQLGFDALILGRGQALLECFGEPLPVVVTFKLFQTLLKIHAAASDKLHRTKLAVA
jgi:hypothetical protein